MSPYSDAVNERAARYFEAKHGLETIVREGFRASDAYANGQLGPEKARDAFARIDRPEIEVFVVPGGNFPTISSVASWEREFKKPAGRRIIDGTATLDTGYVCTLHPTMKATLGVK